MPKQVMPEIENASSLIHTKERNMTDADVDAIEREDLRETFEESQAGNGKSALDAAIDATQQNPSLDDFTAAKVQAAASFTLDEPRGHHLYWIACNGKHLDLADARCQKLSVVDWIVYNKEVVRKSGEINENGMVACLFLLDGRTVSWASPTTNRQWCAVVKIFGKGPYSPPVDIVLVPNPSKDKDLGPWYSILPWGTEEADAAIKAWKESR